MKPQNKSQPTQVMEYFEETDVKENLISNSLLRPTAKCLSHIHQQGSELELRV